MKLANTKRQCPPPGVWRKLLNDQLTSDELNSINDHLDHCANCRAALAAESDKERERSDGAAPWEGVPIGPGTLRMLAIAAAHNAKLSPPNKIARREPVDAPIEPPALEGFTDWSEIGRGGTAVVFRAHSAELNQFVAVKSMTPGLRSDSTTGIRNRREIRLLSTIDHPNVVRLLFTREIHGALCLVMEYVDGGTLQDLIDQAPVSACDAAEIARDLARALQAVHEMGIIHRDIKPSNILLDRSFDRVKPKPRLTDFGIAREMEGDQSITTTGVIVGTPNYMAPEQTGYVPACGQVSAATDIHALGAVLYAMLTGQPPYFAVNRYGVLLKLTQGVYTPPRALRPEIPSDLESIVIKCLEHLPSNRYSSAATLALDLDCFLHGRPVSAGSSLKRKRLKLWSLKVAAIALGFVVLVACVRPDFSHDQTPPREQKILGTMNEDSARTETTGNEQFTDNRKEIAEIQVFRPSFAPSGAAEIEAPQVTSGQFLDLLQQDLKQLNSLALRGKREEGLEFGKKMLAKLDSRFDDVTEQPRYILYLVRSMNVIMGQFGDLARPAEGCRFFPRLLKIARDQSNEDIPDQSIVMELVNTSQEARRISKAAGRLADSIPLQKEIQSLIRKRYEAAPTDQSNYQPMFLTTASLASSMFDTYRIHEWEQYLRSAQEFGENLLVSSPEYGETKSSLYTLYKDMAMGMGALSRFKEAQDSLQKSLKFASPDDLGMVHGYLARAAFDLGEFDKSTSEANESLKYPASRQQAEELLRRIESAKANRIAQPASSNATKE